MVYHGPEKQRLFLQIIRLDFARSGRKVGRTRSEPIGEKARSAQKKDRATDRFILIKNKLIHEPVPWQVELAFLQHPPPFQKEVDAAKNISQAGPALFEVLCRFYLFFQLLLDKVLLFSPILSACSSYFAAISASFSSYFLTESVCCLIRLLSRSCVFSHWF